MELFARVVDSATGQGLANATISIDGRPVSVSDINGNFSINNASAGMNISASYVGYESNSLPEGVVADDGQIQLTKLDASLPAASVVATIKKNPIPFAIGAGALLLLLNAKKKKQMGKIDTTTILLIGGAALAAYLIFRPRTAAVAPVYNPYTGVTYPPTNPYLAAPPPGGSSTAQDITAAGGAVTTILNSIFNS